MLHGARKAMLYVTGYDITSLTSNILVSFIGDVLHLTFVEYL